MRLQLSEIARVVDGQRQQEDVVVEGMTHDSRRIEPGMLFVALAGERVDGHDYLEAAAARGAAAALVSRPGNPDLPQVVVADTRLAMGRAAAAWRDRIDPTVVGVTGSNGKTTVKEMVRSILATRGPTLATQGNYNNEIGLPLTMSRLAAGDRFAVLEMGCGQPGDIRYLAGLARPEVGVITNAGPAHLERLGSIEGVARTKGELFEALPDHGCAVINADDRFADFWRERAGATPQLSFGLERPADISATARDGAVEISTPAGCFVATLRLPGRHNLMNALAATAVGVALEIELDAIAEGLGALRALPGRLEPHRHPDGWTLIDDTYNANPASLYAGLQVLTAMDGEPWLVLGDMAELGADSEKLHAEMGQSAGDLGIRRLFSIGRASRASSLAFGKHGRHFESHQALIEALAQALHPGVNCLVKGSRSMTMERVVQSLLGEGA
ncbi:MAG: UDP-N-acetylmuramoyl-tripeptide--D-alanyl-D-alanine ligase [Wenzhouxiangella sp.]|jgi:UDP-N-acetylmuramoyl-tripeptide--D-alanyl-D-alanine ligase|nr:UDP-N-acetylmuramoyl-tripeptide--D-alanyl-D-alanine ligase [Wenzhouxiangella sp.]